MVSLAKCKVYIPKLGEVFYAQKLGNVYLVKSEDLEEKGFYFQEQVEIKDRLAKWPFLEVEVEVINE